MIYLEESDKQIMTELKSKLLSQGNLLSFFGKLKDATTSKKEDPDAIAEKNNSLLNSDPFGIPITMDEFITAIKEHKISN